MPKRSLSEDIFGTLMGRSEVKRIQRTRSPCGGAKRRVKIIRTPPSKLLLSVTEPDHPRVEFEIETSDHVATAAYVESFLRRQRVCVLNK
jgi:hypothetical protein